MRYQLIEHTADIGIRVFGNSVKELFEHAGEALFDLIFGLENVSVLEAGGVVKFAGDDMEELMVDWLGGLLIKYELEKFITARPVIYDMEGASLTARLYGEKLNPDKHLPVLEIKGVTYHGLKVEAVAGIWKADVIFDV